MRKLLVAGFIALVTLVGLTGCNERAATVASHNLSEAADNFEIQRRIVFYNGITGENMAVVEGRCSIKDEGHQLEVTCKIAPNKFKKDFLGLSDNISYFAMQLELVDVNTFHHRIVFRPQTAIPDIDIQYDGDELIEAITPDSSDKVGGTYY